MPTNALRSRKHSHFTGKLIEIEVDENGRPKTLLLEYEDGKRFPLPPKAMEKHFVEITDLQVLKRAQSESEKSEDQKGRRSSNCVFQCSCQRGSKIYSIC